MIVRIVVAAAVCVAGLTLSALPAAAAPSAVLTKSSLGGPPVQVGDVISSGLKANTEATFTSIKCTSSSLAIKVATNPPAGGTATGSLTTMTFANCTTTITGVTCVQSITGAPSTTIDINGGSLAVTWESPSMTFKFCTPLGTVTCVYQASSAMGMWSNGDNSMSLSAMLTKSSGPVLCQNTQTMAATWSPVRDGTSTTPALVFAQ
jgi:hypothetical protein